MKILNFDAARWETPIDIYADINAAVDAPVGYGKSVNALFEAMVWDHADDPSYPPYAIHIRNLKSAPKDVQNEVSLISSLVPEVLSEFQEREGRAFPLQFVVG